MGYSKLPDGTLIQYGFFGGTLTTNDSKNVTREIAFPYGFAGTAPVSISITPATLSYLNGSAIDSITLTGFRAILMGAIAANTTYDSGFRWIAIGRWK